MDGDPALGVEEEGSRRYNSQKERGRDRFCTEEGEEEENEKEEEGGDDNGGEGE